MEQEVKNRQWSNITAIGSRIPDERVRHRITRDGKLVYFVVDENDFPLDRVIRDVLTETGEIVFIDITETYRGAINRLENAIQMVKDGNLWNDKASNPPERIKYDFLYPNGKNGDIDMFIASEYGRVKQIAPLIYEVVISTAYKEQIALMGASHFGRTLLPQRVRTINLRREEITDFLYTYNLCFSIHDLIHSALDAGMCVADPLRKQADNIRRDYMGELRNNRRQIYAELASHGLTSAKWKSEQQAYTIIKSLYPDAVYQYKADWLGFQSLDVFIPNLRIGIEYQGAQHYRSVSLFGGDEGLKKRLELDEEKRKKCKAHGITLIDWRFDEPLTAEFISLKIASVNL